MSFPLSSVPDSTALCLSPLPMSLTLLTNPNPTAAQRAPQEARQVIQTPVYTVGRGHPVPPPPSPTKALLYVHTW